MAHSKIHVQFVYRNGYYHQQKQLMSRILYSTQKILARYCFSEMSNQLRQKFKAFNLQKEDFLSQRQS